jgi:hypothetical protein
VSKGNLLLYLVALQCLGRRNARRALADEGVAWFAGLEVLPRPGLIDQFVEAVPGGAHAAFAEEIRRHLLATRSDPVVAPRDPPREDVDGDEWLSLWSDAHPLLADRELDRVLSAVSAVVLRSFAARLGAFSASSPAYICRNFLESQAELEIDDARIAVNFFTCPLRMVLRMAGFESGRWTMPWAGARTLEVHFP